MRTFELRGRKSAKFWKVELQGDLIVTLEGKVGTAVPNALNVLTTAGSVATICTSGRASRIICPAPVRVPPVPQPVTK